MQSRVNFPEDAMKWTLVVVNGALAVWNVERAFRGSMPWVSGAAALLSAVTVVGVYRAFSRMGR